MTNNNTKREETLRAKYGPDWRRIFSEAAKRPRPNGGNGGFRYLKEHNPDKLRRIIEERDAKKTTGGQKSAQAQDPTPNDQDIVTAHQN